MDYIDLIAKYYPDTECYVSGSSDDYSSIVWISSSISAAELDGKHIGLLIEEKIIELSTLAHAEIVYGFESSSLGFPHIYDSAEEDQLNLIGAVAAGEDLYYSSRPLTEASQGINLNGAIGTSDLTGLTDDATIYTASVTVDSSIILAIEIVGSSSQSYGDLIIEVNSDISSAAELELDSGDLVIRSLSSGESSIISLTDIDLFLSLSDFLSEGDNIIGTIEPKVYKMHSAAEIKTVLSDGKDIKLGVLQKFNAKKNEVLSSTTEIEIAAIVWD